MGFTIIYQIRFGNAILNTKWIGTASIVPTKWRQFEPVKKKS